MTVFLACSTALAVFDISPHLENGVPILPVVDQLPGTIRCVLDIDHGRWSFTNPGVCAFEVTRRRSSVRLGPGRKQQFR